MKAVLAILAASLLLAGCTKPSDGSVPEQDGEGRYVIHMTSSNRFAPEDAKVPVGATVIWVIDGGVHDVTAQDGSWKSPRFMSGATTFQHTFTEAGDYEYHCDLHSSAGMDATLHVSGDGPTGGADAGDGTATASQTSSSSSTTTSTGATTTAA